MLAFFGVEIPKDREDLNVFPLGLAPFIRLEREGQEGGKPAMVADEGAFGLRPGAWAKVDYGKRTYNARSETVATLPSFRRAWANAQRCVIPAESIFEPRYFGTVEKPGKSERWRISRDGDVPMGIAGVYARFREADGTEIASFAMLTVNADGHPVMQQFHKPGEEKRMVVILDRDDYMPWLTASLEEAPRYFRQWTGPLKTEAAPNARGVRTEKLPPEQNELF